MKKLFLFTVCAVLFGFGTFAQDQEQEYDTVVYFPSTILQCPMLFDTAANRQYVDNSGYDTLSNSTIWFCPDYDSFGRLDHLEMYCDEDVPGQHGRSLAKVVGHTTIYNIRSFAQPYYLPDLDTSAILIGVAAKIYGDRPPIAQVPGFILYDHQGNMVDNCAITYMKPIGANRPYAPNPTNCELYYYIFQHRHKMQAFSIAYDKNNTYYLSEWGNVPYEFDHTIAFEGGDPKVPYYHVCAYTDYGCYEYIPPFYLLYDSTEWVRFDEDSLYSYYHKMQIGFYPIFLMPKSSSGLSETELSQHCNLVPNPASTRCKVISRYKLQEVEVYDMGGRRIMKAKTNGYEHFFDVSAFEKGTYIVVISTDVGKTSKQLIVN